MEWLIKIISHMVLAEAYISTEIASLKRNLKMEFSMDTADGFFRLKSNLTAFSSRHSNMKMAKRKDLYDIL